MTPADLEIRPGFPAGLRHSHLWRWLNSPREPNFDDFGPETEEQFDRAFFARLEQERIFTGWLYGAPVAYCGFKQFSPHAGQFHGVCVAPEYRRQGIGTLLLVGVIARLEGEGLSKFLAMIFADNKPMIRIFKELGFSQEGYLSNASKRTDKPIDAVVMGYSARSGKRV